MGTNCNTPDEETAEGNCNPAPDFWSAEGAKRYNEALDEGGAYLSAGVHLSEEIKMYLEDEPSEYRDPELIDPNEETLPPGEMELIFENCYLI